MQRNVLFPFSSFSLRIICIELMLHDDENYANMSIQYTAIFHGCKNGEKCYIFLIFAQNIDYGYTLETHQRGGSNEYPQSMF